MKEATLTVQEGTAARTPHPLLGKLAAIVGDAHVLSDEAGLAPYTGTAHSSLSAQPGVVVRPTDATEVAKILELASFTRTPMVVRGGGFSTGGSLTIGPTTLMLDTTRLNRVIEIDGENHIVTAECGITVGALQAAVMEAGYLVNTVSSALADRVTLGGLLSGMLGGGDPARVGIYGVHARQLLALTVALPGGSLLSTGAGGANIHRRGELTKGAGGPDLTGIFVGDGGAFGVKVRATLQMFPLAPLRLTDSWTFQDFTKFHAAFSEISRREPLPFAMLFGAEEAGEFRLDFMVEAHDHATLQRQQQAIATACARAGGTLTPNGQQAALDRFMPRLVEGEGWASFGWHSVTLYCARSEMAQTREAMAGFIERALREAGLARQEVASFDFFRPVQRTAVHATFGLEWVREPSAAEAEALRSVVDEAYRLAVSLGCSPTGHFASTAAIAAEAWSPEYRATMAALKQVFDPQLILNPGQWG